MKIKGENIDLNKYQAVLRYDLYGLESASNTTKSINNNIAYGGKTAITTDSWVPVNEKIAINQLKPGVNEITLIVEKMKYTHIK
ncbi:hypothetical protein [Flavobacterium sp. MK4S-17]|uniref:hypothetical protein n=1 Tax=Flavobacterium sp. MK4S-17 TaxID=2543737 RepID=UPI001357878E|nr:hypothetical protein [Flavobacterium sp. MK4S-17]